MSITEEHITHILAHAQDGDSLAELWDKCTLFVDKAELASALRVCVNQKRLFRHESKYFAQKQKPTAVVVDAVCRPQRKTPSKPRSRTKTGSLPRNSLYGDVALILFTITRYVSVPEILAALGRSTSISPTLKKLYEMGYVYQWYSNAGVRYKWSGRFTYPFPDILDSDAALIAGYKEKLSSKEV